MSPPCVFLHTLALSDDLCIRFRGFPCSRRAVVGLGLALTIRRLRDLVRDMLSLRVAIAFTPIASILTLNRIALVNSYAQG